MRVVWQDATKLVIDNNHTPRFQGRWGTCVLGLGIVGLYFLVSKVAYNIIYLWAGILTHFFCLMLGNWYFTPIVTTFNKINQTVLIERVNLLGSEAKEYPLAEVANFELRSITTVISTICLALKSGRYLYLSNSWHSRRNCQKVLNTIINFCKSPLDSSE